MGDLQLIEGAAELGQIDGLAGQFLLDGQLVHLGREEDGVPVAIEAAGNAVIKKHLHQHLHVADDVLLHPEVEAQDLAGGIIDGAVERHFRATVFQPCKRTGIALNEHALPGHPVTGAPPPGNFVRMFVGDAGRGQHPANGA